MSPDAPRGFGKIVDAAAEVWIRCRAAIRN